MAAEKFQNAVKMSINSNPHLLFICLTFIKKKGLLFLLQESSL